MQRSMFRQLLAALSVTTLLGVGPGLAQTTPGTAPSPAASTSPASSTAPAPEDDVDWFSIGATAECRDGTFFHGAPEAHACVEHGGVRRWLRTHEQDLIR